MNRSRFNAGISGRGVRIARSEPAANKTSFTALNSNTRVHGPVNPARQQNSSRVAPYLSDNLGLNSERQRDLMVQRLRAAGIADERVLAAMRAIPRHVFVDQGLASRAYQDAALPIGYDQTISQPWIVAYMLAAMAREREPMRVLEIGAGCGYQSALLAHFVPQVYAVERIGGLYELAQKNLAQVAPYNDRIRLHFGDGMAGLPQFAPFDGIIVAAAGVKIPHALLQQLAIGARLLAPVGEHQQKLVMISRSAPDSWERCELEDVKFVPLRPGTQP